MAKKQTILPQDQKEFPTTSYHYKDNKKAVVKSKQATKTVFNVSQSMIKDVRKYLKKEMCGLVLKAKYITKTYPYDADDSPAKKIGRYFEYILFGGLPKSGKIPQPEYMVSVINAKKKLVENKGKTDAEIIATLGVDDMYEPYRLAHANASRVRHYFEKMDITIISVGVTISKDGMEGTIDIRAMYKGQEIVIDVKYSGLIDDQWNELGWRWTREQKKFHGTQATHYHILTDVPFYFLVVSSTNLIDILFNEIVFDDHTIQNHFIDVEDTRQKMETYNEVGFNAYPDIKRCSSCALRDTCESRQDVPEVKLVWLNEDLI